MTTTGRRLWRWGVALAFAAQCAPIHAQHQPPFAPLVVDGNLTGWVVEKPGPDRATSTEGVLHVSGDAGLVRTDHPLFRDFRLRFEAQAPLRTHALLAILGHLPTPQAPGVAFVVPLFGDKVPDNPLGAQMRIGNLAPSRAAVERVLLPAGEWQSYEVVNASSSVTVMLNGTVILSTQIPLKGTGWMGFRAFGGDIAIRNMQLAQFAPQQFSQQQLSQQQFSDPQEPVSVAQQIDPAIARPGNGVSYPVKLKEVRPQYTSDAMRAKISGVVLLECVVLADGTVGDVRVARSLDAVYGLDREAVRAAKQWRFRPGMRDGVPIPVVVFLELTFTLKL